MRRGFVAIWLAAGLMLVAGCRALSAGPGAGDAAQKAQTTEAVRPPVIAAAPSSSAEPPANSELWRLSRDAAAVSAGQKAFTLSSCRTCHGPSLTGGAAPNLVDQLWLYGGTPREVYQTIVRGVPSKGMPTWGPALDPIVIQQIVAFIFSHHREGEPIEKQESFAPFTPVY